MILPGRKGAYKQMIRKLMTVPVEKLKILNGAAENMEKRIENALKTLEETRKKEEQYRKNRDGKSKNIGFLDNAP